MIYKTDGVYVISAYRSWKPGVYFSKRAAKYAFRFTDEEILSFGPHGTIITFGMLQRLRRERR